MALSGEHADPGVRTNREREALVGSQQLAFEFLCERNVCGIVGGEVRPEFQDPGKQPLMSVPHEREVKVITGRLFSPPGGERSSHQGSAKAGDHLYIAECRDVEVALARTQDSPNRTSRVGTEEVLDEGRCVGDDNPQETSRAARSSWMRSAAARPSLTGGLASILSKTSSAGGLATSRSKSPWM